jgi:hypothetical protein
MEGAKVGENPKIMALTVRRLITKLKPTTKPVV